MIIKENYGPQHIQELQKQSHKDPQLIERALYALGLLEALAQTGMDFILSGSEQDRTPGAVRLDARGVFLL